MNLAQTKKNMTMTIFKAEVLHKCAGNKCNVIKTKLDRLNYTDQKKKKLKTHVCSSLALWGWHKVQHLQCYFLLPVHFNIMS